MYLLLSNWPLRQARELDQYSVGGGCTTHLPPQAHQKYINTWNSFYWKLAGDWQKGSYTTMAVRKIHMELGRKRRVFGAGPVPLKGDSEEKGDYPVRDRHWGVSSWSHILGTPALGSDTRKMGSLGWLEDLWSQQAHEKMLNITNHQRNANQNYNEVSFHTSQKGHHQKVLKC